MSLFELNRQNVWSSSWHQTLCKIDSACTRDMRKELLFKGSASGYAMSLGVIRPQINRLNRDAEFSYTIQKNIKEPFVSKNLTTILVS